MKSELNIGDRFSLDAVTTERLSRLDVQLVYLFGSFAEGTVHALSDLDIGIVSGKKLGDRTSDLYNQMYDIFTDVFPGHSIDIVFLERAGLELRYDVIRHGRILYEVDEQRRNLLRLHVFPGAVADVKHPDSLCTGVRDFLQRLGCTNESLCKGNRKRHLRRPSDCITLLRHQGV